MDTQSSADVGNTNKPGIDFDGILATLQNLSPNDQRRIMAAMFQPQQPIPTVATAAPTDYREYVENRFVEQQLNGQRPSDGLQHSVNQHMVHHPQYQALPSHQTSNYIYDRGRTFSSKGNVPHHVSSSGQPVTPHLLNRPVSTDYGNNALASQNVQRHQQQFPSIRHPGTRPFKSQDMQPAQNTNKPSSLPPRRTYKACNPHASQISQQPSAQLSQSADTMRQQKIVFSPLAQMQPQIWTMASKARGGREPTLPSQSQGPAIPPSEAFRRSYNASQLAIGQPANFNPSVRVSPHVMRPTVPPVRPQPIHTVRPQNVETSHTSLPPPFQQTPIQNYPVQQPERSWQPWHLSILTMTAVFFSRGEIDPQVMHHKIARYVHENPTMTLEELVVLMQDMNININYQSALYALTTTPSEFKSLEKKALLMRQSVLVRQAEERSRIHQGSEPVVSVPVGLQPKQPPPREISPLNLGGVTAVDILYTSGSLYDIWSKKKMNSGLDCLKKILPPDTDLSTINWDVLDPPSGKPAEPNAIAAYTIDYSLFSKRFEKLKSLGPVARIVEIGGSPRVADKSGSKPSVVATASDLRAIRRDSEDGRSDPVVNGECLQTPGLLNQPDLPARVQVPKAVETHIAPSDPTVEIPFDSDPKPPFSNLQSLIPMEVDDQPPLVIDEAPVEVSRGARENVVQNTSFTDLRSETNIAHDYGAQTRKNQSLNGISDSNVEMVSMSNVGSSGVISKVKSSNAISGLHSDDKFLHWHCPGQDITSPLLQIGRRKAPRASRKRKASTTTTQGQERRNPTSMVIDLTGDEDGATETQRKQGESPLTRENEIPRSSQRQQKQTRKQGEMEPSLTPENDPRSSQRQQKQTIKQGETQRKHEEMESSLTPENDPRSSQRQQKQTIKQGETQRKHEEMGSPLTPENEIPRSSQRQQNYKIYGCEFRRCRAELHSFETLMHHIFKVHGTETYPSQSPEPEKWYCMWIDCASVFESRGAWIQHISLEHLQTLRQASTVPCRVDGCATPLTPENQDLHYLTVHPDFARDEWNAPDAIGSELYQTPLISVQSGDSPDPFQSTRKKRSRKSFTPGRVLCVAGWSSDYEDILAPLLGPKRSVSSDDPKPKSTSSESSPVLAGPGPWMTINQDL